MDGISAHREQLYLEIEQIALKNADKSKIYLTSTFEKSKPPSAPAKLLVFVSMKCSN